MDLSTLTNEQLAIVQNLDGPLFVSAGAGSGKTFTLTQRIVWAFQPGSAPDGGAWLDDLDQALVITFTEKAAAEIKERTRTALRAEGLAAQALKVDSAWISTIHGMCARILRRHALELGIDPAFKVGVGLATEEMLETAIEATLRSASEDPAYAGLLSRYKLSSSSPFEVTVESMVRDVINMTSADSGGVDAIVAPGSVDVAAELRRMGDEYASLAALGYSEDKRVKYAAGAASIDALLEGLAPSERLDPERALAVLSSAAKPARVGKGDLKERATQALELYAETFWNIQLTVCHEALEQVLALASQAMEAYSLAKSQAGVLDNNDLLRMADAALESHPAIARAYAEKFRLVMVDEFQDTDAQQVRMIKRLAGEGASRLTTVGDAQQSIYRFRGADVSVFDNRRDEVDETRRVELTRNFRSHDDVLRFVERVFGSGGLIPGFMDLSANPERKDGYKATEPRINLQLVDGARGGKGHPEPVSEDRTVAVAASIANRLATMRDEGALPGDMALLLGKTRKADVYLSALRARGLDCVMWGGSTFSGAPEVVLMASLLACLANPGDSQSLYQVLTSDMFRLDADDLVALGTSIDEVHGVPRKRSLSSGLDELAFVEGIVPSKRLLRAHDVLRRAQESLSSRSMADVCLSVCEESGWLWRLEGEGVGGQAVAANVLKAIDHIRDLVDELGLGPRAAALEYARWLDSAKEPPASFSGESANVVRIMTIHKSKGLEFPIVAVAECFGSPQSGSGLVIESIDGVRHASLGRSSVVVDVEDEHGNTAPAEVGAPGKVSDLPDLPVDPERCETPAEWRNLLCARDDEEEAAEQCRLLYVALTRAREALVVGVALTSKEGEVTQDDTLASRMLTALFGDTLPAIGVSEYGYGGTAPARVERTRLSLGEDGCVVPMPELAISAEAVPSLKNPWTEGLVMSPVTVPNPMVSLFDPACEEPPVITWRAREGVFSYSSAHAAEQPLEVPPAPGIPALPPPVLAGQDVPAPDEPPAPEADVDRATSLGSAFHELAQLMVETGAPAAPGRIDAVARANRVSARQRVRLEAALARWEGSAIRAEALAHDLVRAEVPFFCEVTSTHGRWLEGAIDLLATNMGSTSALVVDYKTGDAQKTADELRVSHEMQARYYAHVLIGRGYEQVTCAFVCVERDDGTGQPIVVRYGFSSECPPQLG